MNKKQALISGLAFMLLFIGIPLSTSNSLSASSSDVEIYAFDQNPAGSDKGNEWVALYNPSNESVDIGNWVLETADGEREPIPEGTTFYPFAYYVYTPPYQWLDNSDDAITLSDSKGEEVDKISHYFNSTNFFSQLISFHLAILASPFSTNSSFNVLSASFR